MKPSSCGIFMLHFSLLQLLQWLYDRLQVDVDFVEDKPVECLEVFLHYHLFDGGQKIID